MVGPNGGCKNGRGDAHAEDVSAGRKPSLSFPPQRRNPMSNARREVHALWVFASHDHTRQTLAETPSFFFFLFSLGSAPSFVTRDWRRVGSGSIFLFSCMMDTHSHQINIFLKKRREEERKHLSFCLFGESTSHTSRNRTAYCGRICAPSGTTTSS